MTRMEAYEIADKHGYKYVRSRIGYSIYRHKTGETMEIGDDRVHFYNAPTRGEPKAKRFSHTVVFKAKEVAT